VGSASNSFNLSFSLVLSKNRESVDKESQKPRVSDGIPPDSPDTVALCVYINFSSPCKKELRIIAPIKLPTKNKRFVFITNPYKMIPLNKV